jgi:hypothetical protein
MRRSLLIVFSVILGVVLTGVIRANDRHDVGQAPFVGFWEGIDSYDGSTQRLSITCARDKSCDVRLNDTAFTLSCNNQIGFARGVGSIDGDVLTVDLSLSCSNLDGTTTPAGSQLNKFVLDPKNKTLTNLNDDPVPVHNVFFKISQ